jgi:hypothetical protein
MRSRDAIGMPLIDRFLGRVSMLPDASGCWLWTGLLTKNQYAFMKLGQKNITGHRLSWQLFRGPIPERLYVLHRCDVRCCVNPEHLFLGTHRDNVMDMHKKGRWKPLRSRAGANGSNAKLTEEDVREIRRLRREKVPLKVVSSRFGIGVAHVVSICKYKVWTYVA